MTRRTSHHEGFHQFFSFDGGEYGSFEVYHERGVGWFWWACSPGCLPDGEPNGPFKTAKAAFDDAIEGGQS